MLDVETGCRTSYDDAFKSWFRTTWYSQVRAAQVTNENIFNSFCLQPTSLGVKRVPVGFTSVLAIMCQLRQCRICYRV